MLTKATRNRYLQNPKIAESFKMAKIAFQAKPEDLLDTIIRGYIGKKFTEHPLIAEVAYAIVNGKLELPADHEVQQTTKIISEYLGIYKEHNWYIYHKLTEIVRTWPINRNITFVTDYTNSPEVKARKNAALTPIKKGCGCDSDCDCKTNASQNIQSKQLNHSEHMKFTYQEVADVIMSLKSLSKSEKGGLELFLKLCKELNMPLNLKV